MPQLDSLIYGSTVLWLTIGLWLYYIGWKYKGMKGILSRWEGVEGGKVWERVGRYNEKGVRKGKVWLMREKRKI